ncbi:arginine--tRNA ligase [Desulfonema ishimotonii]|uniref:Arginine--tRNA ligase n=1 Tax=Desulfonema ishimotonii TaxID=45657 RepID=A0A401G0Y7_9BACT|nr:arginine--tRNA ligase [Desulfonema ishimotonii]GBC62879.1 arginine--tRNA ligase [Desulfonema ishimotonii]
MKQKIKALILKAATAAYENGDLPSPAFPPVETEEPKIATHGDLSTNMAMIMASVQKMAPRKIADAILRNIEDPEGLIAKTEIAGPGFINFFISPSAWLPVLRHVHESDTSYGRSEMGNGKKVQVEFVSANPTGPLHVGHGRGAAVGDAVASLLEFCGYDVQREYYINDSGRQISTLGGSVFLRYRELFGQTVDFPEDFYQGDYIREIAAQVRAEKGESLLGDEAAGISCCARFAADTILTGIRQDLADFGVRFDNWYSEQTLYDADKVGQSIQAFREKGTVYEEEGALWFRTSDFGDEKDRVVVRTNGQTTYFASDIAYHRDKFERGLEWVIDVWGADHHGYIPRIKAAIEATGYNPDQFDVILVQLVNLLRGGEPVAMSSRAGEFVTLKEVVDEVGRDAARFIFLTRHYESKLDFDLELAKKKTNDNPVYYVQYVHARISSIIAKAAERGIREIVWKDESVALLKEPEDIQLIRAVHRYPEVIEAAGRLMEPHRITYYLMELAAAFHAYYNKHKVLTDDPDLTGGRLYLVLAVRKVIRNGLSLLGVSAPEKM